MNAYNHFGRHRMMSQYAASKGVFMPGVAVFVSGLLILIGGTGILFGIYIPIAVACLVIFLLPVSLKMHAFWNIPDPMSKMLEMVNFTKNMALLGACLMLLQIPTPWMYRLF